MHLVQALVGHESRFATSLIGFVANEYVIVRRPVDTGGLSVRIAAGVALRASLFTGTEVAMFATTLLRQFSPPIASWHLEYPKSVRVQPLRAAPRVTVKLDARVRVEGASERDDATIGDLSASGALVLSARRLAEPGSTMEIVLRLPLDEGVSDFSCTARVKSVRPYAGAGGTDPFAYRHGVQFENLPASEQSLLHRFLASRSR
jgi:c-di-GMP-binding flagellar brake protein YcgR